RFGGLLIREMKIEKNEFVEREFPASENRNVGIEREHQCLIELTMSPQPRCDPIPHDTWIRTLHLEHYQALSLVISRELQRHEGGLLRPLNTTRVNESIAALIENNSDFLAERDMDAVANLAGVNHIAFREVRNYVRVSEHLK